MALTNVVFPAPKPPPITILKGASVSSAPGPLPLEGTKAIQYLLEDFIAGTLSSRTLPHHCDRALLDQVREEDAYHSDRQFDLEGDVRDGVLRVTHGEDLAVLWSGAHRIVGVCALARSDNDVNKIQYLADRGCRAATRHRIRAHDRTVVPALPPVVTPGHSAHLTGTCAAMRGMVAKCDLARLASIAISYATV